MRFLLKSLFIFILTSKFCFAASFKHGISVFGDLKYDNNFTHFDYTNPNARKGGTVKFGRDGTFNNLNAFILKGVNAAGLSYLYDSLMEGSDDEIYAYYGLIAQSVKLADDKKSISFILRKEAKFHDGKSITADDVVFTFNTLLSQGHPSYKMIYRDVKEVVKINDHHVKFIFKDNKNRELPIIVASMKVLPKHYFENIEFNKTTLEAPLGSGPYKIATVDAGKSISYVRVDDYWAKDLAVNKGRYNFDKIIFDYYRDSNVLVEAFKAQKYDIRQENVARNWANSYNIAAIENGEIIKKEISHHLPTGAQAFVFNLRKDKFQNRELRKAINYAFDFEWLKNHIFYGAYKRTHSYFSNSDFGYKQFDMPQSDGDGFNRSNLIKAKEILDKAGYHVVDSKLIDPKTGKALTIEFLIGSQAFEMIIAPFVKNLSKLGIAAKIRFVEENQYQTRVNNFDYDVVVAVFGQGLIPGNELFSYWHSSQKDVKGGQNLSGLNNADIDDLVVNITQAKTKEEVMRYCQAFDKLMLENYYTILQWHNNSHRILYRDIFALPDKLPPYSLAIDSWWIK